jgi:hypothetical protein
MLLATQTCVLGLLAVRLGNAGGSALNRGREPARFIDFRMWQVAHRESRLAKGVSTPQVHPAPTRTREAEQLSLVYSRGYVFVVHPEVTLRGRNFVIGSDDRLADKRADLRPLRGCLCGIS